MNVSPYIYKKGSKQLRAIYLKSDSGRTEKDSLYKKFEASLIYP
jgi:hypothetical protein